MIIGLINPNKEIKEPAIHIGLGYLASYARSVHTDLTFMILDTRIANKREQKEFLSTTFDLIGITTTSQTFSEATSLAKYFKIKNPSLPICIGGPHPSTYQEESIIDSPFDFAIIGEGEVTFSDLIRFIKRELSIEEIDGLMYKDNHGEIRKNPNRRLIDDIDQIPFPAYDLFKMNRYPQHRLITSRGCPYQCVFCNSHSIWTNRWRKRSPNNIIAEIKLLLSNYSLKSFVFNDDSFNIDMKRVEEICDQLIEYNYGIIWSTSIRVDRIDRKVAEKMKRSGCYNVSIGIESANNEVLQKIGKKITIEKIRDGIRIFREVGIDVMGQFMIGNPGDTLKTIIESIDFARHSGLNGVEFYTVLPYRDTLIWDFVNRKGKWMTDKPGYEYHTVDPRILFETPEFTYEERVEAVRLAQKNGFYHALSTDRPNRVLDMGKALARCFHSAFGSRIGNKIYLFMRNVYRTCFRKGKIIM